MSERQTAWAARYLKMNGHRRLIGSFNHGSMANALPQAIGAQAAFPKRQVVSLSGDGGFAMMMGEFITLTQHKLPVKIVVLNNGTLGFVELEMKASGFLDSGCRTRESEFRRDGEGNGHQRRSRGEATRRARTRSRKSLHTTAPRCSTSSAPRQELVLPPTTNLRRGA